MFSTVKSMKKMFFLGVAAALFSSVASAGDVTTYEKVVKHFEKAGYRLVPTSADTEIQTFDLVGPYQGGERVVHVTVDQGVMRISAEDRYCGWTEDSTAEVLPMLDVLTL